MRKKYKIASIAVLLALLMVGAFVFVGNKADAQAYVTLTRQLDIGSSGADVSSLQRYLATNVAIYPEGLVTGYFGPLTSSAVARLQVAHNLPAVGRVGPLTLALLNRLMVSGSVFDNSAAVISNVRVDDVDSDSAVIRWNTSELASGRVYYGTSALTEIETSAPRMIPVISGTMVADTSSSFSKSITLSNLEGNTKYYYDVMAIDASGNVSVVISSSFETE